MRLIDADALKETLDYYIREAGWSEEINTALGWVKDDFIDAEPTVDAVPVIRCKDCKHRPYRDDDGMIDGDYVCPYLCDDPWYTIMPEDDWFCHRGERRDDG